MANRFLCWALILFQAIWFNIVVPGHTRGIVQLIGANPQAESAQVGCPGCCCDKPVTIPTQHSKDRQPGPARTCAICSFAAHMGLLPVIDLSLAPLRLLCSVKNRPANCLIPRAVINPFDGRGPPANV